MIYVVFREDSELFFNVLVVLSFIGNESPDDGENTQGHI